MGYQSILSTWDSQKLDLNVSIWDFRGKDARFTPPFGGLVSVALPSDYSDTYIFSFPAFCGPDFPAR